jgi:hypothetical protein
MLQSAIVSPVEVVTRAARSAHQPEARVDPSENISSA